MNKPKNCQGNHNWSRLPDMSTSVFNGYRTITSCNDCFALKVLFETLEGETVSEVQKIIESS